MKNDRCRTLFLLAMVCLAAVAEPLGGADRVTLFPGAIRLYQDSAGVPHVVASTTEGLYWGYGYCLGRDRLFQLELLRRSVRGTLAELYGRAFLEPDFLARRDRVDPAELKEGLTRSPVEFQMALRACLQGLNAAVAKVRGGRLAVDPAFRAVGIAPSSFSERDLLEIFAGTMAARYNDFTQELDNLHLLNALVRKFGARQASQIFEDVVFFEDPQAYGTIEQVQWIRHGLRQAPRLPGGATGRENLDSPTLRSRKRNSLLRTLGIPEKSGSYAVALSRRLQGEKRAFLLGGPQMGYFKPSALYEIGLHGPDFDLTGTTPAGYIAFLFAANRHLGFTATAGVGNVVDIVSLLPDPKDPGHLVGEETRVDVRRRREVFQVKGEKASVTREVLETALGPIVAVEGKIHFVKVRGWRGRVVDSYAAWFGSNHARTLEEWLDCSDRMALSINWLGADRLGRIAFAHAGLGKTRKSFGDDRLPTTRAPEFPYPDVRLASLNPSSGFFVNWNNPPARGYRDGDLQTGWGRDQRGGFLARLVAANRDRWSVEFLQEVDHTLAFTDLRAEFFLEVLLGKIDRERLSAGERQALSILGGWDGTREDADGDGRYDSPAVGLFDAFWSSLFGGIFGVALDPFVWMVGSDPTWTQTSLLLQVLKRTSSFEYLGGRTPEAAVTEAFQGAVGKLASPGMPLPLVPAAPMEFAGVNHVGAPTMSSPATFTPFMNRGSDVQIMDLSPEGIRVWGVLPPGNAGHGPHAADQMEAFRGFRYRERPLTLSEVLRECRPVGFLRP